MPDPVPDLLPPALPAAARSPFSAGLTALRRFWRPFVLIQSAAVALGLAYRSSDAVRAACVGLARWKTAGGLPFTAIIGAVAGGLLPELAKAVTGRGPGRDSAPSDGAARAKRERRAWRDARFNLAFFAVNGIAVDGLYRTAARLFGNDAQLSTVIEKIAFDQLVFTPTWSALALMLFLARRRGWSWRRTRAELGQDGVEGFVRGFLGARVLPLLVSNWCFWIPIVAIVYALPGPLQFLMFAFALAAWSLIMVFIANQDRGGAASD